MNKLVPLLAGCAFTASAAWYNDTPAQKAATWDLCLANSLISQTTYETVKQQTLIPAVADYYQSEEAFLQEYQASTALSQQRLNRRKLRNVCLRLF